MPIFLEIFNHSESGEAKGTPASQYDFQAASRRLQVVIHTKFALSRLKLFALSHLKQKT